MPCGRTPHGVRELKREVGVDCVDALRRRTPHGVRELKPYRLELSHDARTVAPHTGCVN